MLDAMREPELPKSRKLCYDAADGDTEIPAELRRFLIEARARLRPTARTIKVSAKFARNPLKRLISDERIQGNPSFSNPVPEAQIASNGAWPGNPNPA
jgi:hypothetical protein